MVPLTESFAARALIVATTVLVSALLVSHALGSGGHAPARADALPRPEERLSEPLLLPHCPGAAIVEWKPSTGYPQETAPSQLALSVIDSVCGDAILGYPAFLRARKLEPRRPGRGPLPEISLLPGNTLLDGKERRNLNDLAERFGAVVDRCCYWGLYVDSLSHLFLRNDALARNADGLLVPNSRFRRTLFHELAHVLNARMGIVEPIADSRDRDEELAEQFVSFMGIGFATDTSREDLDLRTRARNN